ncbi:transcription activator MSS11 [Drosophila ficusphila]|uniref:transcription activator MSS11 n=1 Tax=Drosophila ficusphila TaxID=30025 RepID=UPI0007E68685|nr:transcription activator MSS11 [Drosophila ficusphila]
MNFCSVPYEADYSMYADSKMKNVPQYPMGMNPGQGQSMSMQPLNPPQMNLQMQMPMSSAPQMSSYPMQGMPLNMMSAGNQMTPMSTTTSQLPIGAVTPLSSMTMMPMMGNPMGAIDAPGMNAVIPDLQPMSAMGQMPPMQQYNNSGSTTQMHQGRLTGGGNGGMTCPSSPSHPGNWNSGSNNNQLMSNGNMWQYSQPMQSHQPQYHQQQQQQHHFQHQNHQQQGNRMKSSYDMPSSTMYRDVRNGLNTPSGNEYSKCGKSNQSFNCGKSVSKAPHWR